MRPGRPRIPFETGDCRICDKPIPKQGRRNRADKVRQTCGPRCAAVLRNRGALPGMAPKSWDDRWMPEPNTGCHLWLGSRKAKGYGRYRSGKLVLGGRRYQAAHRVAWERVHGPIPTGQIVRHKCDTPACVNPDHLETGTHLDNARDRVRRGRGRSAGKPLSVHIPTALARLRAGDSPAEIAADMGVTRRTITRVRQGSYTNSTAKQRPEGFVIFSELGHV